MRRDKHYRFFICSNFQNSEIMDKIAMQIRLLKIEELSYRDKTKLGEALQEPVFVKLLLNILPDIGRNIIELIVGVVYHTNSEDLLAYEIKSTFEVGEMEAVVCVRDYSVFVAPELLSILVGVSIGTLRGMLVLKSADSFFGNYPLPIINITELIASLQTETVKQSSYFPFFRFRYE